MSKSTGFCWYMEVLKCFLCPLATLRIWISHTLRDFPGGASGKDPTCKAGDTRDVGSNPGLGRSTGGGHGNPVQCSCLENSMGRGAWWATVHGLHMRVRVRHDWSDLAWMQPFRVLVFSLNYVENKSSSAHLPLALPLCQGASRGPPRW